MMAVVLARGAGRRMRMPDAAAGLSARQQAAADHGAKVMMPLGEGAGRPFLDYALSALADAGCTEVCLVVPPDHDAVRAHYTPRPGSRLSVRFAVQFAPTGMAAALLAAAPVVGDRSFLVANGDNLYPPAAIAALAALDGCGLAAFTRASLLDESGFDLARVARFATVTADADGWLTEIREKPPASEVAVAAGALVSMNLWRFDPAIFAACRAVALSPRGEYELPDAVSLAMAGGMRVRVMATGGAVLDLTNRSDIAAVSRRLALVTARL